MKAEHSFRQFTQSPKMREYDFQAEPTIDLYPLGVYGQESIL